MEDNSGTIDGHGLIVEQGWKTRVGRLMNMVYLWSRDGRQQWDH